MSSAKALLTTVLFLGFAACSTLPPTETFILPNPPIRDNSQVPDLSAPGVRIDTITLAPYLSDQGMVIASEGNRITTTRNHRWGEPMRDGIRRYLSRSLHSPHFQLVDSKSPVSSTARYAIHLQFDAFHSIGFSHAIAEGKWSLIELATREVVLHESFQFTSNLEIQGYEGIVAAQADLLDQLSRTLLHRIHASLPVPHPQHPEGNN